MSDHTELKRLVDRVLTDRRFCGDENHKALADGVLALIDENEQLSKTADCWDRLNVQNKALSDSFRAERDQLKAEIEELLVALKGMTSMYGYCWDIVDGGLLCMQDNVQRFEDAHEVAQKVIAAMGKGEQ